ncbi:MAG TPA: 5'-nucleotidase C-terminal domain-containing protein [Spirochaetota bacterium]|nr:5'-nucleotidase C-terminal domain-containing protein [Spirochaetota bacterium]HOL56934.1 5'-nucleotidase C-terminal domain-containing protein [Spirochaetota bacterium]HPP04648.1 5'-nucleotidase C-terminal domain-containing protein [Spirochaetota bacterium]
MISYKKIIFLFLFIQIISILYSAPTKIKILFTCDTNGRPLSFTEMQQEGQGGIPARATLIKKLIGTDKKKGNVLILDTGSVFIGRPESDLYNGETDIAGMNAIGYDAVAIGITEIMRPKSDFDKLNNLAEFYYISSNLFSKSQTGDKEELIGDDYFIKKFGNVTVGIFSLITEDALLQLPSQYREDYIIKDPITIAKEMVEILKTKKKVDIIIALTHLGYYPDDSKIGSRTLANSVKGIDIIIDGVTGLNFTEPIIIGNTKIFQVMKWGLYLGEIDITFENKKITDIQYKAHPVNYKENGVLVGEALEDDPKVLAEITKKMKNYEKLAKKKLTTIEKGKNLSTQGIRERETELGNLICDAILDYTKADIAFQNAGGIEQGQIDPNNITRETFDKIIRYDNSIVTLNLTGSEIKEILSYSMSRIGYGAFLQVSGISFVYSRSSKSFKTIKIKNKELDEDTIYKVAINSWLANGGDGYKIFIDKKKVDHKKIIREVVYDYIASQKILKPSLNNRIVIED